MDKLPAHEAKVIRKYVDSQTRDENDHATTVQQVGGRRLGGRSYEFFDVWTETGTRWWVITNPLNLYSQEAFQIVEQAFTHHLGLSQILRERDRRDIPDDDSESVTPAWRRFVRAANAMNDASEAEDFQAVGIKCREALIALARQHMTDEWVPTVSDPPQAANFKGWLDIYAEALFPARRPRSYLKTMGEKTWDLTVWLQHYADARDWDAEMVLDATAHLINTLELAIVRHDEEPPARCPQCDSYRLSSDGDIRTVNGEEGWLSQEVCSACGWRGEEEFTTWAEHFALVGGDPVVAVARYLSRERPQQDDTDQRAPDRSE
jgi:hypothetical protein